MTPTSLHVVLGCLAHLVADAGSYTTELNLDSTEDVPLCITEDGHQGFCLFHFQCTKYFLIKLYGEGVLDLKSSGRNQAEQPVVKECPKLGQLPRWCCRNDTNSLSTTTEPQESTPRCGVMNSGVLNKRPYGQLYGTTYRQLALFGELPWSVALFSTNPNQDLQDTNGYFCGGSLIHPSLVLSAAHCFNNRHAREVRARVGDYNLHNNNELIASQTIEVTKIVKHKHYYDGNRNYDIALLALTWPAELKKNVATVCLPHRNLTPTPSSECYASGWGRNVKDVYPSTLAKIRMMLAGSKKCEEFYEGVNLPGQSLCAISLRPDKCAVDGGSPLVCKVKDEQNRYVLYGIMSLSQCRDTAVPGVYADVAALHDWIDTTVRQLGYDTSS